jgi:hypothetical protein
MRWVLLIVSAWLCGPCFSGGHINACISSASAQSVRETPHASLTLQYRRFFLGRRRADGQGKCTTRHLSCWLGRSQQPSSIFPQRNGALRIFVWMNRKPFQKTLSISNWLGQAEGRGGPNLSLLTAPRRKKFVLREGISRFGIARDPDWRRGLPLISVRELGLGWFRRENRRKP